MRKLFKNKVAKIFFLKMGFSTTMIILSAVTVMMLAVLYPTVSVTIIHTGVFQNTKIIETTCKLKKDQNLVGCEKSELHEPSGLIFYACYKNLTERQLWAPPMEKFDKSFTSHGVLSIYNTTVEYA